MSSADEPHAAKLTLALTVGAPNRLSVAMKKSPLVAK
jgi:hypothetical protein